MVAKCISVSIGVLLACGAGTARLAGQTAPGHDAFYYMTLMNKASAVMLAEGGIVPPALGGKIAKGIEQVDADQAKPGARRPADYLVFEADLLKAAGPDASRLHTGRSRQDMGSTSGRMFLREGLLDTFERLNHARGRVLALAALHQKTIIPAYTHGVQAQPTSLAHYLLAFDAALQRDGERFRAAYADINLSPLGAAALGTSGFAIDRKRLAVLLGFDGVVDNSYDANHWSPQETNLELSNVVAVSAIGVGHFVQDLHTQYHQPVPWIVLKEGPLTGISSIMPQKRNPSALEQLREIGSTVIGQAQTVYFVEHNTVTGMSDYRGPGHALDSAKTAQRMYTLLADVVDALDVRVDRALDEVNGDYSTMTEVADSLLRISDVPFRIGHHFASELANYGRANRKTPKEIPYAEAQRIYKEATEGQTLPLTEAQFKEALSAENMVFNRHGLGGPQLSEIDRMLSEHRARLSSDTAWTKRQRDSIAAATAALDKAFAQLMAKAEGGTFATPTPSTSQAKPAPEDKFLTVGGLRLHYLDWGGAGKPPLLMFHGIARHAHTFDHIAADLSRDYHVIAVDLRGHGDSAWSPDGAYLVEDYVKDLDGLVGQLRLKNLTLLGNSTGGRVAQVFAGMHPELVSAVVVEDVGPERPQDIASGFARRVQEEANGWASEDELVAQLVKQNARTPEPLLRTYAHYGLKPRADGRMIWKRDPNLVKGFVVTELWQHVSRITAPTIYILGGASTIVPADTQQRLKKTLPRVEIVTMPGLGHYPDSEDAAGFMAILNRFLKRS